MPKNTVKTIKNRYIDDSVVLDLPSIPLFLQKIFSTRGVKSPQDLDYHLKYLLPWDQLKGINEAVLCIASAIENDKKIVVVGDFDADGATSSALAVRALRAFGAKKVDYLVPNRFTMGYGLTPEIVVLAQQKQAELLITVDNGIASHEGVDAAHAAGMQVVITDHHLPAATLPHADAIVNPNQPGDTFPSKSLCGVGVVFYVMLALRAHLKSAEPVNMGQFLDLVALGTVADLVSLDYNNRILVQQGLLRIRKDQVKPGIKALLKVAGKSLTRLTAADLGFAIAPRLNAAGRLEDMSVGIECLLTDDVNVAEKIAEELNTLNLQRRDIEREMHMEAKELLKAASWPVENPPAGVCLYADTWHQGVIGILASRVKEQVYRPVICFANDNEEILKGSVRSIPGVHIRDALDAVHKKYPDLIIRFGGHAMAAGLTIKKENFTKFKNAFSDYLEKTIEPCFLTDTLLTDGVLSDFDLEIAELIHFSGPWGQGFPEPLFTGTFKVLHQGVMGDKHLRLTLKSNENMVEGVAFFVDRELLDKKMDEISIVYKFSVNEYREVRKPQLIVEEFISS